MIFEIGGGGNINYFDIIHPCIDSLNLGCLLQISVPSPSSQLDILPNSLNFASDLINLGIRKFIYPCIDWHI